MTSNFPSAPPGAFDDVPTPPVLARRPGKVIAVHLNYRSRASQRGRTPEQPSYFLKPSTSLAAPETSLARPAGTELLVFEGEIALVIGVRARGVSPDEAWRHVGFVTAANDLGVYDLRHADRGSNLRSKGGDGFTPIGPGRIDAANVDPRTLRIRTWVNDTLAQEDSTRNLIFSFDRLIADLSQLITLEVGDVILTGTPAGSSVIAPGDIVEVEVDELDGGLSTGRLRTMIVAGQTSLAGYGAQPQVDDRQRIDAWGSAAAAGLAPEFVLDEGLVAKLKQIGTATLSAQLRKRGLENMTLDGVRATKHEARMVGRARTLRFIPRREDLFERAGSGHTAQKRAFDQLSAGDVLVIEARGELGSGTVGDILALRAQVLHAAGVVTDGGVRDLDAINELSIPVFSGGAHPAVLGRKHVPWEIDVTISCGGAAVEPGDVIVGDADGLVVIPPPLVTQVVEDSMAQALEERYITQQVARGASVMGLYPMDEAARHNFERWCAEQGKEL